MVMPPPSGPPLRVVLLLVAGLLSLGPHAAFAQVEPDTSTVEKDVERSLEDLDAEDVDPTPLVELLEELAANPLDVNTASAEDLALIPALGPALALAIVRHRQTSGLFGSLPELQRVPGITEAIYQAARPYLTIGASLPAREQRPSPYPPAPSLRDIFSGLRFEAIQRVTRRLDLGRGFDDDTTRTTYLGSPERLYTRLQARYRRQVSLNLTLEKDPGEVFEWNPDTRTYGYDHIAGHVALADFGRLERLIVGDFEAAFGQGVVLWRSFAQGKGRDTVRPLTRFGAGLRPYGSTEENRFFRGLAATVRLTPDVALSGFASRRRLDATLFDPDTTTGLTETGLVSSFGTTGLHRTPTELARKDALQETLVGGDLTLTLGPARVGVTGYHATFDRTIVPGDAPYQRFAFRGDEAAMIGINGLLPAGALTLFGEVARDPDGDVGGLGGVNARFHRDAEAVILARVFPRDFTSLHGFAFGERNGRTQNETGYYLGLRVRPYPRWTVSAFVDQYRFPWLRFGVPMPSSGYEALLLVEHRPRSWLSWYVQARTETRDTGTEVLDAGDRPLDALTRQTRQSLRLHGDYAFSRTLRLRARLELVRHRKADRPTSDHGVLLFQDVRWLPRSWLQLDARLAFFDTDSFDARVFAYENDLLYTFSVPAFSGRGQRAYVLLRLQPGRTLTVQAKYAVTRFEDVTSVGSGLDETPGNRLREIRLQIRWRL